MIEQGFTTREEMNAGRQRAVLITIDYDGQTIYGDAKLYRGRAVAIHAPKNFHYTDRNNRVAQIDREICEDMFRTSRIPVAELKRREFAYMEAELLKASREMAAHGPPCALIPIEEYRGMERQIEELYTRLHQEKAENLRLAEHNMVVRNQALRWKALAKRLRIQRDSARYMAMALWRRIFR